MSTMSAESTRAPAASLPAASRGWIARLYGSTIGKKVAMAVTGVILVGFVLVHMSGNLVAYKDAEALDGYAHFLQSNLVLLWTVRLTFLASVVIHVHAAVALSRAAVSARPDGYATTVRQSSTWAARLMRAGGVLLLVFLVFHILHFTTGTILPSRYVHGEVYANIVRSFSLPLVAGFYLLAMVALAFHLRHGVWSFFQTLGANHPHLSGVRRGLAVFLAVIIPLGFAAVPLGVLFGLLS